MDRLVFIFIAWEVVIEMFWSKKAKQARKTKRIYSDRLTVQSGSIKVNPSNYQHVGARENQEDAFAFSDLGDGKLVATKGILAILADGMGGLANGEQASQAAVNTFLREYNDKEENEAAAKFLLRAATVANAAVFDLAYNNGDEIELGTTLVAALINGNSMHTISVGDSRIYLFDQENLSQITSDDSVIWEYFEQGIISKEQMLTHPLKNLLTRAVGLDAPLILSPETLELPEKFLFTITSDGLTDVTSDQEIAAVLKEAVSLQNCADNLIKLARQNNSIDDVSIILVSNYLK